MGTPTRHCDITPPLRSGFQKLHKKSMKSMREVERRQTRGRDGGPGPCSERGLETEVGQRARAEPAEQEARAELVGQIAQRGAEADTADSGGSAMDSIDETLLNCGN